MFLRLQRLANEIMKYFVTKNLAKDEFDSVKLHATVINTKLREMKSLAKSGTRGQSVNRVSFDATQITEVNFVGFYSLIDIFDQCNFMIRICLHLSCMLYLFLLVFRTHCLSRCFLLAFKYYLGSKIFHVCFIHNRSTTKSRHHSHASLSQVPFQQWS